MSLHNDSLQASGDRGLGFAYMMTATAIACICVSGVFGSIFSPDFVSTSGTAVGYTRQHTPVAAYSGWIWNVIAIAMVLPAAMRGFRAKVTDRVPWAVLGLGAGGIWLAVMFVSIFAPVLVSGTAPWLTWTPLGEIFAVIAGLILTYVLCKFVKTGYFEPDVNHPPAETAPLVGAESGAGGPASKLRQLASLRDSGLISEDEYQAKKKDVLSRI